MEELQLIDIADELLILNRKTIETLYQLDNCTECIALYMLYYKLAKWQKTNIVKANDSYVQKCLKWGRKKIIDTKCLLKQNGLIEIVQKRNNGKIDGWFIKIHYIISKDSLSKIKVEQEVSEQEVLKSTCGEQEVIALRLNINCLKKEIELLKGKNNKLLKLLKEANKITKSFVKPTLDEILNYCRERKNKIDPEHFRNYYESNGWKVGKNPMKDWKATIRNWEINEKKNNCLTKTSLPEWYDIKVKAKELTKEEAKEMKKILSEFS